MRIRAIHSLALFLIFFPSLLLEKAFGQTYVTHNESNPVYLKNVVKVGDGLANFPNILNIDHFGAAIANIGDIDGDGVDDLAVGAYSDNSINAATSGQVYILYMNANGTVKGYLLCLKSTN